MGLRFYTGRGGEEPSRQPSNWRGTPKNLSAQLSRNSGEHNLAEIIGGKLLPRDAEGHRQRATRGKSLGSGRDGQAHKTILHVDVNAFFAIVEQQCSPQLRGKPILICGSPSTRTVVAACSYEAKARGIQNGMSLGEALQKCPEAIMVEGNPSKYVDTSTRLFAIFREFTPQMEIYSIDEAFLDVTNSQQIYGGARNLALQIKRRIREEFGAITCSIGIGPNKLVAKLASDMEKPDGLVEIPPEKVKETLEDLPVTALCGIGDKLAGHLARLGIHTVGELGRFDRDRLVLIFGVNGRHLHDMGNGLEGGEVDPYFEIPETKSMGHSHTLSKNTREIREVKRTLLRLCEMVGRRLRIDHYAGRVVHLYVRFADMSGVGKQRALKRYIDEGSDIFHIACSIMDELLPNWHFFDKERRVLKNPVRLVGISVRQLIKAQPQLELYTDSIRRWQLREAIDSINDKYGEFTVFRGMLLTMETNQLGASPNGQTETKTQARNRKEREAEQRLRERIRGFGAQEKTHGFLTTTQKRHHQSGAILPVG
jgi:DNA polymerase-4